VEDGIFAFSLYCGSSELELIDVRPVGRLKCELSGVAQSTRAAHLGARIVESRGGTRGDSITAEKAERIGLVNYVVPAERLMDKARELATKFAEGPRLRLRVTKRAIHLSIYDRLAAHMEFEAAMQSHMIRAGKE
jgi:enoyl-CoA hydratase/carnithine racemase